MFVLKLSGIQIILLLKYGKTTILWLFEDTFEKKPTSYSVRVLVIVILLEQTIVFLYCYFSTQLNYKKLKKYT